MDKTPANRPDLPSVAPEQTEAAAAEAPAEDFEFDENAADEIQRAIDDSEGHENERGLTNWHVN